MQSPQESQSSMTLQEAYQRYDTIAEYFRATREKYDGWPGLFNFVFKRVSKRDKDALEQSLDDLVRLWREQSVNEESDEAMKQGRSDRQTLGYKTADLRLQILRYMCNFSNTRDSAQDIMDDGFD